MKIPIILLLLLYCTLFYSCNNDDQKTRIYPEINGVVQKGPFLNGTSVTAFELTNGFHPTGKSYSSQIMDNSGNFLFSNVALISDYIHLRADGFYFNEITGKNSDAPITLQAIGDISSKSTLNVNILSHLTKSRIEYLISTGKEYNTSRKQALQEVLSIFSFTVDDLDDFDVLDITNQGDKHAILLAVSLICQGFRTESELSALLADIITDIRTDGVLNNADLGSLLINDARLFNLPKIRENIEERYQQIGMDVTIPDFEKYIELFTKNTSYIVTNQIIYPEFSEYGENILYGEKTKFKTPVSMAAEMPIGTSLKVVLRGGIWWFYTSPYTPINWNYSIYDFDMEEQTFTAIVSGTKCDLLFHDRQIDTIEIYENNATEPTRVKYFR